MKPKIGIVITYKGIEAITVMNEDHDERMAAYRLLPLIEKEINQFETAFLNKIKEGEFNDKNVQ